MRGCGATELLDKSTLAETLGLAINRTISPRDPVATSRNSRTEPGMALHLPICHHDA
jgi:hypothetical protein